MEDTLLLAGICLFVALPELRRLKGPLRARLINWRNRRA